MYATFLYCIGNSISKDVPLHVHAQDRKKRKRRPPAALLDGTLAVEMPLATVRSSASTSRASTPEQHKDINQVGMRINDIVNPLCIILTPELSPQIKYNRV